MSDLVAFVTARTDELEAAAQAATQGTWCAKPVIYGPPEAGWDSPEDAPWEVLAGDEDVVSHQTHEGGGANGPDARHIALHDPARALREVAATRALLELHGRSHECSVYSHGDVDPGAWCDRPEDCSTLRAVAAIDCGHPDYDPAWKPAP